MVGVNHMNSTLPLLCLSGIVRTLGEVALKNLVNTTQRREHRTGEQSLPRRMQKIRLIQHCTAFGVVYGFRT